MDLAVGDTPTTRAQTIGRLVKWTIGSLAGIALIFLVVGLLLPSKYSVERSSSIDAGPEHIHELVGELKRWPEWTPWLEDDPTIKVSTSDQTNGVGAHQSWIGESGSGELTITASSPQQGIEYDLSFDDGAFQSKARLVYANENDATTVTWVMSGDVGMNIIGRYFGIMMDSMVGPMFEAGLGKLKVAVEGRAG